MYPPFPLTTLEAAKAQTASEAKIRID